MFELWKMFKGSLSLEWMPDLDAKGAKGIVKVWNFHQYKRFFQKKILYRSAVKNSYSTYVFYAPEGLFWTALKYIWTKHRTFQSNWSKNQRKLSRAIYGKNWLFTTSLWNFENYYCSLRTASLIFSRFPVKIWLSNDIKTWLACNILPQRAVIQACYSRNVLIEQCPKDYFIENFICPSKIS